MVSGYAAIFEVKSSFQFRTNVSSPPLIPVRDPPGCFLSVVLDSGVELRGSNSDEGEDWKGGDRTCVGILDRCCEDSAEEFREASPK